MEALKEGKTLRNLIDRAVYWDKDQTYSYIEDDIEGDRDIQEEIRVILRKLRVEAI